ncbi:PhiH1 repressor [Halorubrum sp. E3]|nr:PhiH1 repressor [Halorubrum sp. E3]
MRKSSEWMVIWDDRIMEIIRENGVGSASELADHEVIKREQSTVSRRLNKLADHGLLQRLPNGVYSLTEEGEKYLDGELSAPELDDQPKNGDEGAHVGG